MSPVDEAWAKWLEADERRPNMVPILLASLMNVFYDGYLAGQDAAREAWRAQEKEMADIRDKEPVYVQWHTGVRLSKAHICGEAGRTLCGSYRIPSRAYRYGRGPNPCRRCLAALEREKR